MRIFLGFNRGSSELKVWQDKRVEGEQPARMRSEVEKGWRRALDIFDFSRNPARSSREDWVNGFSRI